MTGKQWAILIIVALLFIYAPQLMMGLIAQFLHSLSVFGNSMSQLNGGG